LGSNSTSCFEPSIACAGCVHGCKAHIPTGA
jgi:hypothetical protein